MDLLLIGLVAFLTSGVTLFSGFGLGTVLLPTFALFFPVPVAIAATAVVHLANNLFKLAVAGRRANWRVVSQFGMPAAAAAVAGAALLGVFTEQSVVAAYTLGGRRYEITAVKAVIGTLIVAFALIELFPRLGDLALPPRYVFVGALLSGFFGGLSGNQGAFRSAFLIRVGLDKEAFVGTNVACAVVVDTVRLMIYGLSFYRASFAALSGEIVGVVAAATAAAFAGVLVGAALLKRTTMRTIEIIVAVSLIAVGAGLATGLI